MAEPGDPVIRHRLAAAAAACAVGFAVVAALVTAGWSPLVTVDEDWSSRAYSFTLAHDHFRDVAQVVTDLAYGWTVVALTGVVAVVLALRRTWLLAWWLVLTVAGSALLSTVLKVGPRSSATAERRRAHVGARLLVSLRSHPGRDGDVRRRSSSWWGGRSCSPGRATRVASAVLVTPVIGAVGLSRIYLGAHWPSDVLGGWLSGSAWVLAATVVLLDRARRPAAVSAEAATGSSREPTEDGAGGHADETSPG